MVAGCPAVVGNLWDVTDRDLDRFCVAHLSSWLQQDIRPDAVDIEQKPPNPKVRRSCHARDLHEHPTQQMAASVAHGRAACHLSALVGAAPVCYGLPCRTQLSNV